MITTDVQPKTSVTVRELNRRLAAGQAAELLDVRTPGEYAAGHVPGVKLIPLDELDPTAFCLERGAADKPLFILCQSGGRARKAIEKLERAGVQGCVLVEGGTQAWLDAGLPVNRGESKVLPLMRQVQITIGIVSATGAALALAVNPWFAVLPLITGCGLLFAGITGYCGLAMMLAKMPWNKSSNCNSASCCASESK
jgi:rhodanese-related sulfurtransferase